MAQVAQVRKILRSLDMKVSRKKNGAFPIEFKEIIYSLKESDVDEYLSLKEKIERPEETSITYPSFYEHALESQGFSGYRFFHRREEDYQIKSHDQKLSVSFGVMSSLFTLSLLDQDTFPLELGHLMNRSTRRRRTEASSNNNDLTNLFSVVKTAQLKTTQRHQFEKNHKQLKSFTEAALFNVAFGTSCSITLSKSWERSYYWLAAKKSETVQFPLRTYNTELVAYYQLALGSDSLILAYLALYKILEYFFTSSSERVLHDKLKEKFVSPDFSHLKVKKLREIIQIVKRFENKMDERKMLITVLEHYFDKDELRTWIEDYEKKNKVHFTTPKELFGEELKLDTSDNQILPTLSSRIYHIRNALVHNKEGEVSRFIPFSGQEAILYKEVPLLLHLAEQLIIKSGKDIQF